MSLRHEVSREVKKSRSRVLFLDSSTPRLLDNPEVPHARP